MLQHIVALSLMITGVHLAFQQGNVLSPIRVWCANQLDKRVGQKRSRIIQKPLWDCLVCMSSIWTLLFYGFHPLTVIAVAGLNAIIENAIITKD